MWFTYPNNTYFDLMSKYKDKIIIEVGGHDHFSSMRYHTSSDILDTAVPATADANLFHNILVNPSVSPWHSNNPGISAFEIDDETLLPHSYHASFLNLQHTIGKEQRTPYRSLEWRDLSYKDDFGLELLTPESIHELRIRLQGNPVL
mmetsp:Transcript_20175/g.24903  ORF Transcript_20175/g.24903 Transcript_20175/m.24903 type:complete len:147 (-) Transcript_20175:421-861(-)